MIWHSSEIGDVLKELKTDQSVGLYSDEADRRLAVYGKNLSADKKRMTYKELIVMRLSDLPTVLLLIAAAVSSITAVIMNEGSAIIPLATAVLLVLRAVLGAAYDLKIYREIESVNNLSVPSARVRRDKVIKTVPAAELVPGDIIILSAGDYIPADARLISAVNLHCNEELITGEDAPAEKADCEIPLDAITPISERSNMVFKGCSVVSGEGTAVVTATGNDTEVRKGIRASSEDSSAESPVMKRLKSFEKIISFGVLAVCIIVVLVGIIGAAGNRENFSVRFLAVVSSSAALAAAILSGAFESASRAALSRGIRASAKHGAVVKRIRSAEALGNISVICCDKTGVLTENKADVSCLFDGRKLTRIKTDELTHGAANLLTFAAVCCNGNSRIDNGKEIRVGDTTDSGIVIAAAKLLGHSKEEIDNTCPRLTELPFDPSRRLMATVNMIDGKIYAVVKGAPELITPCCVGCDTEFLLNAADEMSAEALKVIAVAYKRLPEAPIELSEADISSDLTFCGFIGLDDPIRDDTAEAVKKCSDAGIRTVIVTGDSIETASAVAEKLGLFEGGGIAVTGAAVAAMTDEELFGQIEHIAVFARVSPEDKLRIIRAWKATGAAVAVTGNTVGDEKALREADIGFALGVSGTDVAKGAADTVLADDSYSSLVSSLEIGHTAYENIRRSLHYLLACGIGEAIAVLAGYIVFGLSPLGTAPIILLSLIIGALPLKAICTEPSDIGSRDEKVSLRLFRIGGFVLPAVWQGLLIGILGTVGYAIGRTLYPDDGTAATALCFAVMVLSEVFELFAVRSLKLSFFTRRMAENKYAFIYSAAAVVLAVAVLVTPLGRLFGIGAPSGKGWLIAVLLSVITLVLSELVKVAVPLIRRVGGKK